MRCTFKTSRVVALLALAGAVSIGAAAEIRPPQDRRPEGLPSANRGQSSAMVFSGPRVAAAMRNIPDWARPEYARNNRHLVYALPRALTAIDEWPQPRPPSFEHQRRLTFSRTAETIIIFQAPPRGRTRYLPFMPFPR